METLFSKLRALDTLLHQMGSIGVAFSGGVDSAFLLYRAATRIGLHVGAFTVQTPYMSRREIEGAIEFCRSYRIPHWVLSLDVPPEIQYNPPQRCYVCKKYLFVRIMEAAYRNGYKTVADGTNAEDLSAYRPGLKALRELEVRSPLAEAGLNKAEIREYSKTAGLPTADRPSLSCLLTRLPYGTFIREEELRRIEEAEEYFWEQGWPGVRVRAHGPIARIEVLQDRLDSFWEIRKAALEKLKALGFTYVTLDLEGYRSGSMDQEGKE